MCFHIILIGTFSANVSKEEDNSAGSTDFIESDEDADMFQPKNHSTQIPKRPRVEKVKSKLRDSSLLEDLKKCVTER